MMTFIPIVPIPKGRPRGGNGHFYTPQRTREYEQTIAEWTKNIYVSGAVTIAMTFIMPIPKSWSKKKQTEMCGRPHLGTPDLDNLVKAVLDGMRECWWDDRIVYAIHAIKKYGQDPGILIEIMEEQEK